MLTTLAIIHPVTLVTYFRDYVVHLPASYDHSNAQATPLLLDYHGWTRSADIQMDLVPWSPLSDSEGFIFVSMDGMNDVAGGGDYGSWNVSATSGPLGMTCDPGLVGGYPCYESCDTSGDCSYLQVTHTSPRVMMSP